MITAVCQVSPNPDNVHDTTRVEAAVRGAAADGAQLVVLPELAISGSWFERGSSDHAEPDVATTEGVLRRLSAELGVVLVCGVPEFDGGRWWNAAVVCDDGSVVGRYRKVHLWGAEKTWFAADDKPPLVVDTSVGRLGVMVCYDLEFPEWARLAAQAGAELLAVPVNWPRNHHPGAYPIEVAKAQAAAAMYGVFIAVADRCGLDAGTDWEGGSLICGPDGYLLAGPATDPGQQAEAATIVADLDLQQARVKERGPFNHLATDRRPALYADNPLT